MADSITARSKTMWCQSPYMVKVAQLMRQLWRTGAAIDLPSSKKFVATRTFLTWMKWHFFTGCCLVEDCAKGRSVHKSQAVQGLSYRLFLGQMLPVMKSCLFSLLANRRIPNASEMLACQKTLFIVSRTFGTFAPELQTMMLCLATFPATANLSHCGYEPLCLGS